MSNYFSYFPKLLYRQNVSDSYFVGDIATNIFLRTRFREIIKNENTSYYFYTVRDHDTPESLAQKYYGDPEAHWVILIMNDIVDPYYDWPMSQKNFRAYMVEKYGSVTTPRVTTHHFNEVITTTDSRTGEVTVRKYQIDETDPREVAGEDLPYDDYDSLAVDSYPNLDGTFKDGSSVTMVISREAVSVYDYEWEKNEAKRNIRLLRKDFYPIILDQFKSLTGNSIKYTRNIAGY